MGPSEQDPVSLSVSLSHQEASISLLSFSIRGQIDWKPQSQKTNQSDHMNHSLVSPCHVGSPKTDGSWWRALTKRGPLEKGMANHFSILALRTPWTVIFNYLQHKPYIYIYLGKLALLSIYYFKKLKKTFQVRILERVAIPFSKGSSRPRDWTQVFQTWRQILYHLSHLGSPKKTKHLEKRLLEYSVNSRNSFTQLFKSAEPRTWDHKTT